MGEKRAFFGHEGLKNRAIPLFLHDAGDEIDHPIQETFFKTTKTTMNSDIYNVENYSYELLDLRFTNRLSFPSQVLIFFFVSIQGQTVPWQYVHQCQSSHCTGRRASCAGLVQAG